MRRDTENEAVRPVEGAPVQGGDIVATDQWPMYVGMRLCKFEDLELRGDLPNLAKLHAPPYLVGFLPVFQTEEGAAAAGFEGLQFMEITNVPYEDDSATTDSAPVTAKNPPAPMVEDPPKSPSQQGREAT